MRNPVRVAAAAALIGGPTALAFFSGGFFERPRLVGALVVWALVAVAAVAAPTPLPRSTPARLALLALACFAGWTALSTGWAPVGQRALEDSQRLLLYLGTLIAGVALLRGRIAHRLLAPALAGGTVIVTLYGLAERLLPGAVSFARSRSGEGRLEQPLTYWNALGCLSAIGLVLCMSMAADGRRSRPGRAAAAAAGAPLGLGVYLSFSRGALFALVAGTIMLLALSPWPRNQARVAGVMLATGAGAAAVAELLPTVAALPRGQEGNPTHGLVMLVVLAALSAAAAGITAVAATPGTITVRRIAHARSAIVVALALTLAAGGSAAVAALEAGPGARSAGQATDASRFRSADSTRYAFWAVALDSFAAHPLQGTGAGGFAVEWRRQSDRDEEAVDAHSLYIETLGELGLVGGSALALFLGAVSTAAGRLYVSDPVSSVGPIAAVAVWAVHSSLDWDWEMPALTGIALLLMAALLAWEDELST